VLPNNARPSRDAFMRLSREQIAEAGIAPVTMAFAAGGTRRHAILAGIDPNSDEYNDYSRQGMLRCFDVLCGFGVRNIFTTAIRPHQMREPGRYRARLLDWIAEGLTSDDALRENERRGWRVRIVGAEHVPELREAAERLVAATPANWRHTIRWSVSPDPEAPWRSILDAVLRSGARTREDAVMALYGEPVPPATMFLAFGKPLVVADLVPPLLAGDLQCYFSQRLGYSLDEAMWREILYDYAYLRHTQAPDTAKRDRAVLEHQAVWQHAGVLGLGQAVGPFWFPSSEKSLGETRCE
jgi:hypothetical protein